MSVAVFIENYKSTYFAGDTITGEAIVRGSLNYENGRLHIKLRGVSAIRINEPWELGSNSDSTELICEERIHRLGPGRLRANQEKGFPFEFKIPKSTSSPKGYTSQYSAYFATTDHVLPPTLKIGGRHGRGEISYEISAILAKPEGCILKSKTKTQVPICLRNARDLECPMGYESAEEITYDSLHRQPISAMFQSHKLCQERVVEAPFEVQFDYSVAKETANTPSAAISRILPQRVGTKLPRAIISFIIQVSTPSKMVTGLEAPLYLNFAYDYDKCTIELLPEIRLVSVKYTIEANFRTQAPSMQTHFTPSRKKITRKVFSKTINCPMDLKHGISIELRDAMNAVIPVEEVNSFQSFNLSHLYTSETEVTVACAGVQQTLKLGKKDVFVLPKKVLGALVVVENTSGVLKSGRISVASQWSDMDTVKVPRDFC